MPKVSVITINLNNRAGLEQTIQSVKDQSSADKEFIVIDGASTDGSVDVINANTSSIDKWISEKDKGIYDAMNKGIAMASGDYLLFINSGDRLFSNQVIWHFVEFEKDKSFQVIYGNSEVHTKKKTWLLEPPAKPHLNFWYRKTLNHQAVFMRRDLFLSFGNYNLDYKICADFDILLKVFLRDVGAFSYFPVTVCKYDESGFSASAENFDDMLAEREEILKKHLTEQQYKEIRTNYVNSLPFKERVIAFIYERPVLKKIFRTVYNILKKDGKK